MDCTDKRNTPVEIVQDTEGNYRWTYEVDSRNNKSFLNLYLLIFGLIILIPGAILFFMIYGSHSDLSSAGSYLAIWLAIFVGVELLTILIYKGIESSKGGSTDIPYLMTDEFIIVHAGNDMVPISYLRTDFSAVKGVKLDLNSDLILLVEPLRVSHVYVPKDDIPFVLNFILDRVPHTEKYENLRQKVKKQ